MIKNIYNYTKKYLDYKLGSIGAGFTGSWTFLVNLNGPLDYAFRSSLTQIGLTFFAGGLVMKTCENLATKIKKRNKAIAYSIIIPSFIAIGSTYGIHKMIKTENPKTSTFPSTLSLPACAILGLKKRRELEKIILEEKNETRIF
jgi:hypothetical protein